MFNETMNSIFVIITVIYLLCKKNIHQVVCTIDVNLSELEYLAGHLEVSECRRLVAALHYNTFELPESIAGAERKVDENIPCLRQLLHWNSSPGEGRGRTHEDIEHRLRQINRNDLADWLGKTSFKQLGNDLSRALNASFGEKEIADTKTQSPATLEPTDEPLEEDPWLPVDTLLFATLAVLFACLITLCIALIIHSLRRPRYRENDYNIIDQERGNGLAGDVIGEKQNKKPKTKKKKKSASSPRRRKEESRDSRSQLEARKRKRCCGTSCSIL